MKYLYSPFPTHPCHSDSTQRWTVMHFSFLILLAIPAFATDCNPLTSNCQFDTALASTFKETFATGAAPYFSVPNQGDVTFGDDGVLLTMNKIGDNPTIMSNFYIMFGKVEVVMQAAQGQGIVSSFYLQSDDLDEIDIELFGGDPYEFESNYFSKGNITSYNRGGYHPTSLDPTDNFHTYTIEWTQNQLTWSLDGSVVRVLQSDNPHGYPQSPMRIYSGVWAGGNPENSQGTIDWAGGPVDFSEAPFTMQIKSLIVADYSTGSSYSYTDNSGSWSSISAANGTVLGRQQEAINEFSELEGSSIQQATTVTFTPDTTLGVQSLLATAGPTGSQAAEAGKHQISNGPLTFIVTSLGEETITTGSVATNIITLAGGPTVTTLSTKTTTKKTSATLVTLVTLSTLSSSASTADVLISPIIVGAPISSNGPVAGTTGIPTFANHPLTASQVSSFFDTTPTFKIKNGGVIVSLDSQFLSFITLVTSVLFW